MKKHFLNILISLPLLFGTAKMGAQVTMGADAAPKPFSVLELVSQYKTGTYGGLRLPQKEVYDKLHSFAIYSRNAPDSSFRGVYTEQSEVPRNDGGLCE